MSCCPHFIAMTCQVNMYLPVFIIVVETTGSSSSLLNCSLLYMLSDLVQYIWVVINIPLSFYRVTRPRGNVSSIICLSQRISEVRDVPLSVFIDKSPVLTTKVFYYKENPKITAVLPACSFDRYCMLVRHPHPQTAA